MKNLILDCSCGMNVYLSVDGKLYSKSDCSQNKHTDEILKRVDELLANASIKIGAVENLCVCVGPGSFTGVRVAISIAKGLAIGTNAKVFTLTNFDVFKVEKKDNFYLVLDGFSNYVYSRRCEKENFVDECVDVQELADKMRIDGFDVFVTNEKTQNLLKKYEIQSKIVDLDIISAFDKKIQAAESVELNKIYPVYLRASQAEIERAKKSIYGKF